MRPTRLDLAYDGTGFQGWAAQHHARTVEGELTRALVELHGGVGEVVVAGRTDTGVHATGQVVSVALAALGSGRLSGAHGTPREPAEGQAPLEYSYWSNTSPSMDFWR